MTTPPSSDVEAAPERPASRAGAARGAAPRPRRCDRGSSLRWIWRQLTSMRTALILLFLLALAAIPGSLIPQTRVDPSAVAAFKDRHPQPDAAVRAARDVRGLQLGLVQRDLPAADASRWSAASCPRLRVYLAALPGPPAAGAAQPVPAVGVRHLDDRREPGRGAASVRAALLAAATATGRRVRRRRPRCRRLGGEGLPARGGQPALPPRRRWSCWSASPSTGLYGYKGSVAVVSGRRLLQHLGAVRRLHARRAVRPSSDLAPFSLHRRRLQRHVGPGGAGTGTPLRFDADLSVTDNARRASPYHVRPPGQPPARGRRHLGVPHRPRLRADGDGARRRRRRRVLRAGRSSCRRTARSSPTA